MWFWKEVYAALDLGDKANFAAKRLSYCEREGGSIDEEKHERFVKTVSWYHSLSDADRAALHARMDAKLFIGMREAA
jgi:hypothetical protein